MKKKSIIISSILTFVLLVVTIFTGVITELGVFDPWTPGHSFDMINQVHLIESSDNVIVGKVNKRRGLNKEKYTYYIQNLADIKGSAEKEIKLKYDFSKVNEFEKNNPFEIDNENKEKVFLLFMNKKANNTYYIYHSERILTLDGYDLSKNVFEQKGSVSYTIEHYTNIVGGKVYKTQLDIPSEYDFVGIYNSNSHTYNYETQFGGIPELITSPKDIPLVLVDQSNYYSNIVDKHQHTFIGENPGDVMFYNVNLNKNEENGVNLFDYCEDINVNKPNVNNYLIFGYYLDRFDIDYDSDENKNTIVLLSNDDIIALPDYPIEAPFEEKSEEYKNSVIELVNNKLGV